LVGFLSAIYLTASSSTVPVFYDPGADMLNDWLNTRFSSEKGKNPGLSLRGFAKKLELPTTTVWEILSGKRIPSPKMAKRIAAKLELNMAETEELLKSLAMAKARQILMGASLLSDGEQLTDRMTAGEKK
jgi:hypothetical protein